MPWTCFSYSADMPTGISNRDVSQPNLRDPGHDATFLLQLPG